MCAMVASTNTSASAADMKAELQYLRQRNKELQSKLDIITHGPDSGAISHNNDDNDKDETASSSSFDSGLELTERNQTKEPPELVESNSISPDGKLSSGLHFRRSTSGKGSNGDDIGHTRSRSISFSNPFKRFVKSSLSDVDLVRKTPNDGNIDSPPSAESSEKASFDKECNDNTHFSISNGVKKSSDRGGSYFKGLTCEPPLSSEDGDEEGGVFQDVHIQDSSDSDDAKGSDSLNGDDSSHDKHLSKISPNSHSTIISSSTPFPPFRDQIKERAGWLIGLLFLQSCSSFIIQYNQTFLQNHMVIVQFLTMLVGAGGNAGNQASVRVIRSLAVGTLNHHTIKYFLKEEAKMAICLSALIGTTGFIRASLFRTPPGETIAVTASVCMIVAISVAIGSTLPLGMKKVGIDPAHSSTSIQVIMDILGVLITVCVSSFVLSFKVFQNDDSGGD